jgi:hypothetical protein
MERKKIDLEDISKEEKNNLIKLAKKYDIPPIGFEIEYIQARNNGHPKHKDALKFAEEKITSDIQNQYNFLKENNINYNF